MIFGPIALDLFRERVLRGGLVGERHCQPRLKALATEAYRGLLGIDHNRFLGGSKLHQQVPHFCAALVGAALGLVGAFRGTNFDDVPFPFKHRLPML